MARFVNKVPTLDPLELVKAAYVNDEIGVEEYEDEVGRILEGRPSRYVDPLYFQMTQLGEHAARMELALDPGKPVRM